MAISARLMKLELVESRAILFNQAVICRYYCKPLALSFKPDDKVPGNIPLEMEKYYRIDIRMADGSKQSFWIYVPDGEKPGDIGAIINGYIKKNEDYYINQINKLATERDMYRAAYIKTTKIKWWKPATWMSLLFRKN